jgi:hypothetical protein
MADLFNFETYRSNSAKKCTTIFFGGRRGGKMEANRQLVKLKQLNDELEKMNNDDGDDDLIA